MPEFTYFPQLGLPGPPPAQHTDVRVAARSPPISRVHKTRRDVPHPVWSPPQTRSSSGAWSAQDDQALLAARAAGENWTQIQAARFPSKTPNACRKRHERLMERKDVDDWDTRKLGRMAVDYLDMRRQLWTTLAARTGEKWDVLEQKCMSNGLKTLQNHARAYARKKRLRSGQPPGAGYDDDNGVGGAELTPLDGFENEIVGDADSAYGSLKSGALYYPGHPTANGFQAGTGIPLQPQMQTPFSGESRTYQHIAPSLPTLQGNVPHCADAPIGRYGDRGPRQISS